MPAPRFHPVPYFGVLAAASKWRPLLVPKPLPLVRGDRRKSIVVVEGDDAFIGLSRSALERRGELLDLAKLNEYGGPPVIIIIPITPKMRRFLFALLRHAGKEPTGGSGHGVVVVKEPA